MTDIIWIILFILFFFISIGLAIWLYYASRKQCLPCSTCPPSSTCIPCPTCSSSGTCPPSPTCPSSTPCPSSGPSTLANQTFYIYGFPYNATNPIPTNNINTSSALGVLSFGSYPATTNGTGTKITSGTAVNSYVGPGPGISNPPNPDLLIAPLLQSTDPNLKYQQWTLIPLNNGYVLQNVGNSQYLTLGVVINQIYNVYSLTSSSNNNYPFTFIGPFKDANANYDIYNILDPNGLYMNVVGNGGSNAPSNVAVTISPTSSNLPSSITNYWLLTNINSVSR